MTGGIAVLHYYRYVGGPLSQTVYSTHYYCGSCRRDISRPYSRPEYPEDLEAKNESVGGWCPRDEERSLEHYSFCPWCGSKFAEEWWKDRTIQNERAIDHYQNPGTHKGDTHEFRGKGPECIANHRLAASGGSHVCWCDPDIEPGIMGCVIRHQDKRYDDVMAARHQEDAESEDDYWREHT